MNNQLTFILIIFILSIALICYRPKKETFVNSGKCNHKQTTNNSVFSKHFNIDHHLKCEPHNLGWKNFWRKNYSQFSNNLELLHSDHEDKTIPPLLFDGVRDVKKCPLYRN